MAMAGSNEVKKLLNLYTKDYRGPTWNSGLYGTVITNSKLIFYRSYVPLMLKDPHLWFGMELLKGPIISKAKYIVESADATVQEYVQRQIDLFWKRGVAKALDCLSWGYNGCEIVYDFNHDKGWVEFKDLEYIHPRDCRPVTRNGKLIAMQVRNSSKEHSEPIYLKRPKFLWTVNEPMYNKWYGRSKLEGAFDSWWEAWGQKGYRAIRHLWFYKNAFSGGTLYFPDGSTPDPETGAEISNAIIAQEMLDRKETGGSLALPQKTGDNREWEWEEAKGNPIPEGLLEYGDLLRDEMWEGIGVPPEVARQEDSGGFAGRRVPQQAFYSMSQQTADNMCYNFDEQCIRHNVNRLFGPVDYLITPISILQTLQEEEMGLVTGKLPGQGGGEVDENGQPIEEEEQELDEEGNPIEDETLVDAVKGDDRPNQIGKNGKVEDRASNAHNMKQKAQKNQKKGK